MLRFFNETFDLDTEIRIHYPTLGILLQKSNMERKASLEQQEDFILILCFILVEICQEQAALLLCFQSPHLFSLICYKSANPLP